MKNCNKIKKVCRQIPSGIDPSWRQKGSTEENHKEHTTPDASALC